MKKTDGGDNHGELLQQLLADIAGYEARLRRRTADIDREREEVACLRQFAQHIYELIDPDCECSATMH